MEHAQEIRQLIDRVGTRWRRLRVLRATVRASLAVTALVGVALLVLRWSTGAPGVYAAIGVATAILAIAVVVWGVWPLRDVPTDAQIARFIEERAPSLDDRIVSAVDGARPAPSTPPGLMEPMLADAARRAREIDLDTILPVETVRRTSVQATAATLALAAVVFVARDPARQALDAASISLFPSRVALEVKPGNARITAGTTLAIHARLVGNRAPVIAQVQVANGDGWRATDMAADKAGAFRLTLDAVHAPFKYRVVAGSLTSPTYEIAVAYPPRVTHIDVDYTYPAGLGLAPRTEQDSGDIYAPAGTDVRVHVFTDRAVVRGTMALGDGRQLILKADAPTEFSVSMKVVDDNSYRVALADRDGLSSSGETEYFIRTLADRPPEVRILKPATDRNVTRLQEVDIEAQAEDDYGVARLDLVYSVRGGAETIVPLPIAPRSAMVSGRHTLYLEDLDVQPGDFISYYARARDLTRGTRPNEARSDIFFLEVKPYEQEFSLAQSAAAAGGGAQNGVDDLVTAQKEIVVATWKLDRRARSAGGAKSEQDIRTVAKAEAELRTRVEQTSSSFRESTMRDPRRRQPQRGRGGPPPPPPQPPPLKAGETMPEEDDMTAAAAAMGKAVTTLDALKTSDALPPEMEALNRLLKAQADVKKRQVAQQQAGSGAGNNRSNYDMSTLFDKELRKTQQTNYETKSNVEQREDANQSALDKIKDLARRQDELLKRQQDLARDRGTLGEEALKRELEKLTRDQMELRQRAEELARQMASQSSSQSGQRQSPPNAKSAQPGQQTQSGQQRQAGRGQQGQSGQSQQGQSGQGGGGGDASQRVRDASEQMRSATSDLRRNDPNQASASGNRALEQLKAVQRQLESARPDERRRALGELQLEARQLADAERQMSSSLTKAGSSDADKDTVRRLAGEQERVAERTRTLQESLKQQGAQKQAAAGEAAKDLEGQRVAERMQQAADALRSAAGESRGARGRAASEEAKAQAASGQDLARALDRVADTLASATGAQDDESRKLSSQLARAQELREKLDAAGRELDRLGRQNGAGNAPDRSARKSPGETGRAGEGQQGGGGGSGTDVNRLRQEYEQRLKETKDLLDQLRRDDPNGPTFARGGTGFTFEGQGMTLSAPGTEAFKQDFAKWEDLRRQATQALDNAESTLSRKLQAKESRDRLAAGTDDKAPPEYKKQVDDYFKAIAKKKKQ
ncbi:MAG: hypothetical protein HY047_09835 [Acidobacteria bacterium]|nr:hypothetical protein [Acidobacteriota bacterium]